MQVLTDDGDIIRGLGFVTMYSAWVEEDVDNVLRQLAAIEPFDEKTQRFAISRKLEHAAKVAEKLMSAELKELPGIFRAGINLFEARNQVVHGRIYAGFDKVDYVKSGRPDVPARSITSSELYELANLFINYRGHLIGPQVLRIPRAVRALTR
jgi:hypothetical protein